MSKYRLFQSRVEYGGQQFITACKLEGIDPIEECESMLKSMNAEMGVGTSDSNIDRLKDAIRRKNIFDIGVALYEEQCKLDRSFSMCFAWERVFRMKGSKTIFIKDATLPEVLYKSKLKVSFASMVEKDILFSYSPVSGQKINGHEIFPFIFSATTSTIRPFLSIVMDMRASGNTCAGIAEEIYETGINNDGLCEETRVHFKLGVSILCYMQAFPECVVPGIPSDMSIKEMMHGGQKNKRTGFTIKAPIDIATGRALHLRRGHFRSLHDERFKRADDGSIKIVWVRESVVGGKIDPYTVEAHAV